MSIVRKIPGFRSGQWWKMLIASVFYFLVFIGTLDVLRPSALTLAVNGIAPTNKRSVLISGKASSDKPVYLLQSNQEIQSMQADSEGKFFFALNNLVDGQYSYTVQACHSKRKDKCRTENILVVVDQTPPAAPLIALPDTLPDDSEDNITIQGTTEPDTTVIAQVGETGAPQKVQTNAKGNFSVQAGLVLGTNAISVKAVDGVGNESEPAVSTVEFHPATYRAKVARVIDGDTIKLETGEVIRYIGIDTPETVHPSKPVQCYGKEASAKNKELVEGKEVKLEKDVSETDKYNRLLRYIWVGNTLINEYLVREGFAHSSSYPPDVKYQNRFTEAERQAREERKGLWGDVCTGVVQQPTQKPVQIQPTTTQTNQPAPQAPTSSTQTQPSQPSQSSSGSYACNCSKTCSNMSSCAEAQYQLNVCGCTARDTDHDGIACDSDCQ